MLKRFVAAAGMLIFTASLASADQKHHNKGGRNVAQAISQVQADIRRDEAALAAAQRAGNAAAVAREQADLQRDRARLQALQANPPRITTEDRNDKNDKDKNDKKDKKDKKHRRGERERER